MPKVTQQEIQETSTTKPSLSESLFELVNKPYTQNIIQQGEELAEELRTRGRKLSSTVGQRGKNLRRDLRAQGEYWRQELGEYGEQAMQDLARRREKAMRELSRFSDRASRNISKRGDKAARAVSKKSEKINKGLDMYRERLMQGFSERDSKFWALIGFGIGLVAAAFTVIFIVRKRKQQAQSTEEEHVVLNHKGQLREQSVETEHGTIHAVRFQGEPKAEPMVSEEVPGIDQEAKLVGIVSQKRYYPIGTPKQLTSDGTTPLDIVYFGSEAEARAQGYTPAE